MVARGLSTDELIILFGGVQLLIFAVVYIVYAVWGPVKIYLDNTYRRTGSYFSIIYIKYTLNVYGKFEKCGVYITLKSG
jgi:hypothetical protein